MIAATRLSFSAKRILFSVVILLWVFVSVGPEKAFGLYLPCLFIWVMSPSLDCSLIENVFWKLRYVFIVTLAYGLLQKFYGYFPNELDWIYSNVGAVRMEAFFVTPEIRPFSMFSGVPEFGFFSSIMLFFSIQKKSLIFFILSAFGIYLAGSRGIMLSTAVALSILLLSRLPITKLIQPRLLFAAGIILSISCYIFLMLVLPSTGFLESKDDESRLLIYGTFNYRVFMLIDFFSSNQLDKLLVWCWC